MTMQNDAQAAFIESARALKKRAAPSQSLRVPTADPERRQRSLQTCHRYAAIERPRRCVSKAGT